MTSLSPSDAHAEAIVLLARSGPASGPLPEMVQLAEQLGASADSPHVVFAFLEQGTPSLREVVQRVRGQGYAAIIVIPLFVPMEAAVITALERALGRWRAEWPGPWPAIHIGRLSPSGTGAMTAMMADLVASARASAPVQPVAGASNGSIVYPIVQQVMVCGGLPCQAAGSGVIWTYLRNELKRLDITVPRSGVRSARATCLGPCSLAPVVQVFPGPTYYGGVDEAGIDRIIAEHIVGGTVVEDLAYHASPEKQRLRSMPLADRDRASGTT